MDLFLRAGDWRRAELPLRPRRGAEALDKRLASVPLDVDGCGFALPHDPILPRLGHGAVPLGFGFLPSQRLRLLLPQQLVVEPRVFRTDSTGGKGVFGKTCRKSQTMSKSWLVIAAWWASCSSRETSASSLAVTQPEIRPNVASRSMPRLMCG